jgi:hypothetical protein
LAPPTISMGFALGLLQHTRNPYKLTTIRPYGSCQKLSSAEGICYNVRLALP